MRPYWSMSGVRSQHSVTGNLLRVTGRVASLSARRPPSLPVVVAMYDQSSRGSPFGLATQAIGAVTLRPSLPPQRCPRPLQWGSSCRGLVVADFYPSHRSKAATEPKRQHSVGTCQCRTSLCAAPVGEACGVPFLALAVRDAGRARSVTTRGGPPNARI